MARNNFRLACDPPAIGIHRHPARDRPTLHLWDESVSKIVPGRPPVPKPRRINHFYFYFVQLRGCIWNNSRSLSFARPAPSLIQLWPRLRAAASRNLLVNPPRDRTGRSHTRPLANPRFTTSVQASSGWGSEGTVSRIGKVRAKRVRAHWDQIRHDRLRHATGFVPHHVNVRACRGFDGASSGGKDMRRTRRIITLVNGQRSCVHREKHPPRMRVPSASPTRLERDDLSRHINGLVLIQPDCPIEGLVLSFHAELRHCCASNQAQREPRRGSCSDFDDEVRRTNECADPRNICDVNELRIFRHANS